MYICCYADLSDLKSVLFYVSDSNFSGTLDWEDIHLILRYIGFSCSETEANSLLDD